MHVLWLCCVSVFVDRLLNLVLRSLWMFGTFGTVYDKPGDDGDGKEHGDVVDDGDDDEQDGNDDDVDS